MADFAAVLFGDLDWGDITEAEAPAGGESGIDECVLDADPHDV